MRTASADPYTRTLASLQADLNARAARKAAAEAAFHVIKTWLLIALIIVTVVGVGLIVGTAYLKTSMIVPATLAQAEAMRGM